MTTYAFTSTRMLSSRYPSQIVATINYLHGLPDADQYITGGCVGGDSFIGQWFALHKPDAQHTVFVPEDRSQVDAWWLGSLYRHKVEAIIVSGLAPAVYRARNTRMVNQLTEPEDVLHYIADYPEAHGKSTRSGTWMTVRIARQQNVKVKGLVLNG
jgi:hypothetical protein